MFATRATWASTSTTARRTLPFNLRQGRRGGARETLYGCNCRILAHLCLGLNLLPSSETPARMSEVKGFAQSSAGEELESYQDAQPYTEACLPVHMASHRKSPSSRKSNPSPTLLWTTTQRREGQRSKGRDPTLQSRELPVTMETTTVEEPEHALACYSFQLWGMTCVACILPFVGKDEQHLV